MMSRLWYTTLTGLLLAAVLALPLQAAVTAKPEKAPLPQPRVELSPGEVVRIVIDALANNDNPYTDAGIATTFAFASPANKVNTGPLDKFTRMVKGNVYGVMLNHVASEFSEVVRTGNKAYQMVQLTAGNGKRIVFAFRLSQQLDGEFANIWMTDAVWPVSNVMMPDQGF